MSDYLQIFHKTLETCGQMPGRHVWFTARIPPHDNDYCMCGRWPWGDYAAVHESHNAAGQSCECNGEPHARGCPLHEEPAHA